MRVLVADDDFGSLLVAKAAVEKLGHECVTAGDGTAAWELFLTSRPDVVVTDREMPGLDGIELCRRIRAVGQESYTYIVLLTSMSEPDNVLSGMRAGADDYVAKPLQPVQLEATLFAAARVTDLHRQLAETRKELAHQARTDPLTGLRNRLGLSNDLEQVHSISERYNRSYCVAICDVDYFKRYNDVYGHLAGDVALRSVAAALASSVRESDRVYRFGGEEFLVLLPEQELAGALVAMERIRSRLHALGIEHSGGCESTLTVSIGLAASTPGNRAGTQELLGAADRALYDAKAQGRNRLVIAADLAEQASG